MYSPLRAVSIDYTFALLGYTNHDLYFGHLGVTAALPRDASPRWSRTSSTAASWHGRKAASATRGWVMVGYDLNDGSIFNYIVDSQNLWAVYNMVPVLAIDVYEHAYVRDFRATPDGRKQYVEAFFRNLNCDHVNRQLTQADHAKRGADLSGARARAGGRARLTGVHARSGGQ